MYLKAGVMGVVMACLPGVVPADGIYKWVDEEGVTHYSEELPDDRSANTVESIDLDELAPAIIRSEPDTGTYSIVNQAKRMEANRLAAERERAAKADEKRHVALEQAQLEADEAAARMAEAEVETPSYLLVSPPPFVIAPRPPHNRHPMPPHPAMPIVFGREPHAVERLANGPGQTAQRPSRTLHRIDVRAHGPYPGGPGPAPAPLFPW